MDSEIVTKINETENLKSVENSKENVPPAALDKTCEQEKVNEIGNQGEESVLEMATDIPVTKKEEVVEEVEVEKDGGETPLIDTKTITTDIITKKETNGENAKFEIKTTTTTTKTLLCEEKNGEDDPQVETQPTTITVADTIPSQLDESNIVSSENKKLEPEESLPIAVIADNQNMSNNSVGGNVNKSVKDTAESEESGDPSEDECTENDDDEEETDYKTEKIEDAKDSKSNQSSSVTANININAEEVMEKKVINENKDINNQIENIISDIDINIKAQEKITQLKEQELQLIQKQKQLANQIHQQQILAEKLIAENQLKEQELKSQQIKQFELQNRNQCKEEFIPIMPDENASLYNKQQDDFYNIRESSNLSRTVDLRKIFTPATDAPQIIPKNRKLYASSAFYSPTLHPTVEDQVELARRISHSLSDISNQKSKGQSMYDNRKKRSVKWVHEGSAQGEDDIIETKSLYKENAEENLTQELTKLDKMPLKLIMNPRGQLRDYNSLKESINIEAGLLSPDNCAELITALQLHKGRGAELFAKRRRKADNWVVDETNAGTYSPSGIPDYQQYQTKPATSPNILPAYSDAGKHRVQLNLHQDQLIEKYSKPGVQVVKSPWEAALQTGSASSAFFQETKFGGQSPMTSVASPVHCNQDVNDNPGLVQTHSLSPSACGTPSNNIAQDSYKNTFETRSHNQPIQPCNPQRELAYKPSVAQGWGGRNVELPRGLYVPKEISLASYAPPPAQARDKQFTPNYQGPTKADFVKEYSTDARETFHGFPVSNVTSGLYLSQPPKQQLLAPLSYQNLPANSMQTAPQVNFNPSPLSFEKLSKFEDLDQRNSGISSPRYLNISKQPGYNGVRNVTPTPFGSTEDRSTFENLQSSPISTIPKKFGCYRQSTQNAQEYLTTRSPNGQSFNKCARGWNNGSAAERKVFCPKGQFVPSHSLPYSDF